MNVVRRSDRLCVANAVHWVHGNQVIHLRSLEQGPHRDIGLPDGRTCIIRIHGKQHFFAVHGLHIGKEHFADDGLDVLLVSLPIISQGVGCQIAHNVLDPK